MEAKRLKEVRRLAQDRAWELVQNDLESEDPKLGGVCRRLARFVPALKRQTVSEDQARQLIKTGIASVKVRGLDGMSDDDAVVSLLDGLVDKLEGMASFLGV